MPLFHFDHHLTERIRNAGQSTLPLWIFLASHGMWGFAIIAFVLVSMGRLSLLAIVIPVVLTHLLTLGLQQLIRRERPPIAVSKIVMWRRTPSFPSAHTSTSVAWAIALCTPLLSWGGVGVWIAIGAYALACGVAISRIVVGVHYVGDILGGAVLGILIMALWGAW